MMRWVLDLFAQRMPINKLNPNKPINYNTMNELNKNTLHTALAGLPQYEPPFSVWESLNAALDADAAVVQSARQLAQYEPPAMIWENIAQQLPATRPVARRVSLWTRYAAAAAIIGMLFGAWWLLSPRTELAVSEQVVVTQETIDPEIAATVQEEEDVAFTWVQDLCASRAPICEQPAFKSLKSELDELTAAKQELHAALGQYGDDPDMAAQLVQIELARTQLLQEMMQMI